MTPHDYQQAARELARSAAMPEDVAARMARDLEQAFAAQAVGTPARTRSAGPLHPPRVLAAAAAVTIAVGAGLWYVRQRTVTPNDVTETVARAAPAAATAGLEPRPAKNVAVTPNVTLRPTKSRPVPPVVHPAGFVPVPAAARLPQFESGVIVRLSLPVAALPSYGIDISPASSGDAVEADVLVAQDGVARAIRLVNTSRSQQ